MEMSKFNADGRYECPVYYTLKRDISKDGSLVTAIWLPIKTGMNVEQFTKRGVVLGCHTDS